jgi:ParB-like chromosome segregation protein Spo0J
MDDVFVETNPKKIDKKLMNRLAESMRIVGLLHHIVISPAGDGYKVVDGRLRLAAAKKLGWQTIPALVVTADPDTLKLMEISLNLHVLDLPPDIKRKQASEWRERTVAKLP